MSETSDKNGKTRDRAEEQSPGALRRAILPLLLLALVAGAVLFAFSRDVTSIDSLRRALSYNKVAQDDDGKAELYRFSSDRSNTYALLGDALLVVSSTRVLLLSQEDTELFSMNVSFANPAIASGASAAAVYDIGGKTLLILDARGLVRDMSGECGNGVLSAALNASDYLTMTTERSGYKSSVTVYDPEGAPVFAFHSSDRYVVDACLLDDCTHVAAVTLGETDGIFASILTIYSIDSEAPLASSALTGSLVLRLGNLGGTLCAVEDDHVTTFHADGTLAGSCRYEYPYLRGSSLGGDGYTTLLLSRYRSGSVLRVQTVDTGGALLGALDARREILDISAAGRYVAVLYGDSLGIYTSDLQEYAVLEHTDYAKQVLMRGDGTALLIGNSSAWLYIP